MSHVILIIDDDLTTLKLVKLVLQREGYQILTAKNGAEGLRKAEDVSPDLVILDIMLPGIDGYQVCHYLRTNPTTAHIPVLMFSSLDRPADQARAFKVGSDDYLTKPIKMAELLEKVRGALYFKNLSGEQANTAS